MADVKLTMTKRVQIALAVLLIATAGVVIWQESSEPEPAYQGRTVDSWLDDVPSSPLGASRHAAYPVALDQMGPKAVPFIFRKLRRNDSLLINKYRDVWPKLPSFFHNVLPKPKPLAFDLQRATMALACYGTNATVLPMVIERLNDRNAAVRDVAWRCMRPGLMSTNETISLCLTGLEDSEASVRVRAAICLGRMGAAASNAVPALIPLLFDNESGARPLSYVAVRANSATSLGLIGPAASNAIPALAQLISTGISYDRVSAAVALWRITSNESLALPVILSELPKHDYHTGKATPINALKDMGPRAKVAYPVLLSELSLAADDHERRFIIEALKSIDPEAADKAGLK
jgi:hypothetical protein